MNERESSHEREPCTDVVSAQIDRLVSGDLAEPDRRSLLAWLDEDPRRWRACALAFLEAQAWHHAALGWEEEERVQGSGFRVQNASGVAVAPPLHRVLAIQWLGIVALVLGALTIGHFSGRLWPGVQGRMPQLVHERLASPPPGGQPLLATTSVRTNLGPGLQAQLTFPVAASELTAAETNAAESAMSDYERKQWERRGFEVIEERRFLPATLPDGRQVMVPVSKVQLRFKGTPVS